MRKILSICTALILLFTLAACGKDDVENSTPMVNNPPQSEQLSYETNEDGYITSCTLSIDGEVFTYQCEGENYLIIDNTDNEYVILEQVPVANNIIGASEAVRRIYFYEGTAQEFVIQDFLPDDIGVVGTRIQVFNRNGEVIVDRTPRQSVDNFHFSLQYSNSGWPALLDNFGQPAKDSDGNYLIDENAVVITEGVCKKIEDGITVNGNLTSTTYYDIETGKVIYSSIYNVDASYSIHVYDRNDYHLVYQEINDHETLSKRIYNTDGSYSETVTDMNTMEVVSQGNYTADGTLIE